MRRSALVQLLTVWLRFLGRGFCCGRGAKKDLLSFIMALVLLFSFCGLGDFDYWWGTRGNWPFLCGTLLFTGLGGLWFCGSPGGGLWFFLIFFGWSTECVHGLLFWEDLVVLKRTGSLLIFSCRRAMLLQIWKFSSRLQPGRGDGAW